MRIREQILLIVATVADLARYIAVGVLVIWGIALVIKYSTTEEARPAFPIDTRFVLIELNGRPYVVVSDSSTTQRLYPVEDRRDDEVVEPR